MRHEVAVFRCIVTVEEKCDPRIQENRILLALIDPAKAFAYAVIDKDLMDK